MKRRDFIKKSIPIGTIPLYLSGMPVSVMAESSSLSALTNAGSVSDRCLVLVFLDGGNDGINTLIPIDQYDILMRDGSGGDTVRTWTVYGPYLAVLSGTSIDL